MFRVLHTADWHIGMKFAGLSAEAAKKCREARIEGVKEVLRVAKERDVNAILVAGDLFENNQINPGDVRRVAGLLDDPNRIEVYIIPGNHDPFTRDSVYRREVWSGLRPHVHVLTDSTPIVLEEGFTLYPCPLMEREGSNDPTACIEARSGPGTRIGLAHGSLGMPDGGRYFPIPDDAATLRGLDYLALGHDHGTRKSTCGRCWYSGAHETTCFGEGDSGNVLIVEFAAQGSAPRVEKVRIGRHVWRLEHIDINTERLEQAIVRLGEVEAELAGRTLIRVSLRGESISDTAIRVQELQGALARWLHADAIDDSSLRPGDWNPDPPLPGHFAEVELALREKARQGDWAAGDARQMLLKAVWELRGGQQGGH